MSSYVTTSGSGPSYYYKAYRGLDAWAYNFKRRTDLRRKTNGTDTQLPPIDPDNRESYYYMPWYLFSTVARCSREDDTKHTNITGKEPHQKSYTSDFFAWTNLILFNDHLTYCTGKWTDSASAAENHKRYEEYKEKGFKKLQEEYNHEHKAYSYLGYTDPAIKKYYQTVNDNSVTDELNLARMNTNSLDTLNSPPKYSHLEFRPDAIAAKDADALKKYNSNIDKLNGNLKKLYDCNNELKNLNLNNDPKLTTVDLKRKELEFKTDEIKAKQDSLIEKIEQNKQDLNAARKSLAKNPCDFEDPAAYYAPNVPGTIEHDRQSMHIMTTDGFGKPTPLTYTDKNGKNVPLVLSEQQLLQLIEKWNADPKNAAQKIKAHINSKGQLCVKFVYQNQLYQNFCGFIKEEAPKLMNTTPSARVDAGNNSLAPLPPSGV